MGEYCVWHSGGQNGLRLTFAASPPEEKQQQQQKQEKRGNLVQSHEEQRRGEKPSNDGQARCDSHSSKKKPKTIWHLFLEVALLFTELLLNAVRTRKTY